MEKKDLRTVIIGSSLFILLSWFCVFLFSRLEFRLVDIFDSDMYVQIYDNYLLTLLFFIILFGLAVSVFFISIFNLDKLEAGVISAIVSFAAAAPFLILGSANKEVFFYGNICFFFVLGVVFRRITDTRKGFCKDFSDGSNIMKMIVLFVALGSLVGSFYFVKENIGSFEDSLKDIIKKSVDLGEGNLPLRREDVRNMVETFMDVSNYNLTEQDFRDIYKGMDFDRMLQDTAPEYDRLPEEEKERLRQEALDKQVEESMRRFNNPEYKENMSESMKGSVDSMTDKVMEQLTSEKTMAELDRNIDSMMDNMPQFRILMAYLPHLIAIAIFSLVLLLAVPAELFAGLIYASGLAVIRRRGPAPKRQDEKGTPKNQPRQDTKQTGNNAPANDQPKKKVMQKK
jgi:hypothetical protein